MADRNISGLTAIDALASGDLLAVWDASASTTKSVAPSEVLEPVSLVSMPEVRWNNSRWEKVNDATAGLNSAAIGALRVNSGPIRWICPVGSEPDVGDGLATGDFVDSYAVS
jgi:hypothetical protein